MVDILAAASAVARLCERNAFRFCFIGGVAVQRWGNPRFTNDVDLTVITGYGSEERFVDILLTELEPRRSDARAFAIVHRVLLARTHGGVDIDVALGALPFEERSVERATPWRIDSGTELITCSAEDLVVHKAFAGRDRDWDDVRGILTRRHGKLDWSIIETELRPLLELKEEPEAMARLERIRTNVEKSLSRRR